MSSTNPHIPLDVIELIIDECRHDRATLDACSRTARSWLHRSRTHLHRRFTLHHADCLIRSEKDLFHYSTMLRDFPVIVDYADELEIRTWSSCAVVRDVEQCGAQFWDLLCRMRHIRSLRILDMDFTQSSPYSARRAGWEDLFPNIRTLELVRNAFRDPRDAISLASKFVPLATLKLDRPSIRHVTLPSPASPSSDFPSITPATKLPPTPRNISIQNCHDCPEMLAALTIYLAQSQAVSSVNGLKTLSINPGLKSGRTSDLAKFTEVVGASIENVSLTLQEQCTAPDWRSDLRPENIRRVARYLVDCGRLTTLSLSLKRSELAGMMHALQRLKHDAFSPWDIYRQLLTALTDTTFCCSELYLYFELRDIISTSVTKFENIALDLPFGIQAVHLVVFGHSQAEEAQRFRSLWSAALPKLRARCQVYVSFSSSPS